MIGGSSKMRALLDLIHRAAPSNARVLITTASAAPARSWSQRGAALHAASRRRQAAPFVKLNCAAIPSELLESELFGHEKGAFTGATKERAGKFELAHTGTLFLDEIGDLAGPAQAKVLRALQEGEIERVGGSETVKVDVRVLAATNKDLRAEIGRGAFRADLFDRLNVLPIELPPLREHKEDLPALTVDAFVERACRQRPSAREDHLDGAQAAAHPARLARQRARAQEPRRAAVHLGRAAPGTSRDDRRGKRRTRGALPHLRGARVRADFELRARAAAIRLLAAEREIILAALEANEHQMACDRARARPRAQPPLQEGAHARHRAPQGCRC